MKVIFLSVQIGLLNGGLVEIVTDNLSSSPLNHYAVINLTLGIRLHLPSDTADPSSISSTTGAKFIVVLLLQAPNT